MLKVFSCWTHRNLRNNQTCIRPTQQLDLSIKEIETTVELATTLEQLFAEKQFDAIVHAMAVSDFTTETAQTEEQFIDSFAQQLSEQTLPKTKEALVTIVQNTLNQIADIPQTATKFHLIRTDY